MDSSLQEGCNLAVPFRLSRQPAVFWAPENSFLSFLWAWESSRSATTSLKCLQYFLWYPHLLLDNRPL